MGKRPGFYLYTMDLLEEVLPLSCEITGAWVKILCILDRAKERGREKKTVEEWARVLGEPVEKAVEILGKIRDKGIGKVFFSGNSGKMPACNVDVTMNVTVCNRRMQREEESRKKGRERVRKHRRNKM